MERRTLRQLSSIDWNFVEGDETTAAPIHWYPGTFVPALPGALIEVLSNPGDLVFDPYGGAGTTAVAALIRGRRSVITDINPVGLISAYCTLGLLVLFHQSPPLFERAIDVVSRAVSRANLTSLNLVDPLFDKRLTTSLRGATAISPRRLLQQLRRGPPNEKALRDWFELETLRSITRVLASVREDHDGSFLELLLLAAVSANARRLSSQTRSWGHLADNVRPRSMERKDVEVALGGWLRRLRNRLARLAALWSDSTKGNFATLAYDWSRPDKLHVEQADLLITSPPYAGAIDYALSQRLSLYLLGYDDEGISQLLSTEIGARRKRTGANHIGVWADSIANAAVTQVSHLKNGATACFVLPHKDHGRELGETAIENKLGSIGWRLAYRVDRSIRQARTRQSWTSIKQESILVFEK